MAEIKINGKSFTFDEGETLLEVAERNGIDIPTLCYLKDITPTGACRLCLVKVEGVDRLQAACVVYAMDGMSVLTDTEEVWKHRKQMLDFILIKHPLDCPVCDKAGECTLQDTAYEFGMMGEIVNSEKPKDPIEKWNKIVYNSNLCVLCERCVKSCHEMTGCSALKMDDRGFFNHITPSKEELACDFCGTCIDRCPVGALLDAQFHHRARVWDLEEGVTTCTLCPVGCEVDYGKLDGEIVRGKSANEGQICSRGRFAYSYVNADERVKAPMLKTGEMGERSWDEIKEVLTDKLKGIDPESVAMIVGSGVSNEAMAAAKQLMAKSGKVVTEADITVAGFANKYKEKFGTFKTVGDMEDLEDSDVTFVIGADFRRETLGVKWKMMNSVIHNNGKVISINLRKQEYDVFCAKSITADYADFAGVMEDVKTGEATTYQEIREYVAAASKVSVIVGNEYIQAETQQDAVFSLADFIGKDKLGAFLYLNEKTNFMGALNEGFTENGYSIDNLMKELDGGKIKVLLNLGFYCPSENEQYSKYMKTFSKAGTLIGIKSFHNEKSCMANIVLASAAPLETSGTFTTLDGRIARFDKVVDSQYDVKDDTEILAMLGELMGVNGLPETPVEAWEKLLRGKDGRPDVSFAELGQGFYVEQKSDVKETSFSYAKPKADTKVIYTLPRYHSGVFTAKAYKVAGDEEVKRTYHFPQDTEVVGAVGAKYKGAFTEDEAVAKGIVFVPVTY